MSIYTKTGDDGMTSLFGGKRVLKSSSQVEAYGSIDELTSFIGLVHQKIKNKKDQYLLTKIQKDLYQIMSFLAGSRVNLNSLTNRVKQIEQNIDCNESQLPKLNRFILPGGTEISALFHILRTVCRRTERAVVGYFIENKINDDIIVKYLNRLSDLFFIMARNHNKESERLI